MSLVVRHIEDLSEVQASDWNRLNSQNNPFLRHEFLYGLESTGCLEPEGWYPRHLVAEINNKLVAAMPLYLRSNSYGEFVFDWAWADAYERAGGRYYPKLVSAIPFTPVRGGRLLIGTDPDQDEKIGAALISHLRESVDANGLSSAHCLFPLDADVGLFQTENFLTRKGFQFHWQNCNYRDFQDFLDSLTAKKRKQIKRERRLAMQDGLEIEVLTGDQITDTQWQTFYQFYCATFHRRWGNPRMTLEFFQYLSRTLPTMTLLILASKNGEYLAGAFAMTDDTTLYGRHWGCSVHIDYLHFELCYYQTIEYCIRQGLETVDAGVQGEHKLSRGFRPVETWSCHWIQHEGFRTAIEDFLQRELSEIDLHLEYLSEHLPYKLKDGGVD